VKIKKSINVEEMIFNTLSNKLGTSSPTEIYNQLAYMYINGEIFKIKEEKQAKPIFRYIGQKNNKLCKEIKSIESQVKYKTYVEPFAGSLAVLCSLDLSDDINIIVNDINGRLTNFYKVIKEHSLEFLIACDSIPYSQHVFDYARKSKVFESDFEDAVAYFYEKFASYYSSSTFHVAKNKNMAKSYRDNLKFIPALAKRLENVTIINKDFKDVIKRYDSSDTLFYIDSPYWKTESFYNTDNIDECFDEEDHIALAKLLKNIEGRFIYSCRCNTNIYRLYRSNKHYSIDIRYSIRTSKTKNIREKLICNFKFLHFNCNGGMDVKQYK